jgi:hypothetical protein
LTNSSNTVVVVDVDELVDVEVEVVDELDVVVDVEADVVEAGNEVVVVAALVSIAFVDDVSEPAEQAATTSCDATRRARPKRRCKVVRVVNWVRSRRRGRRTESACA